MSERPIYPNYTIYKKPHGRRKFLQIVGGSAAGLGLAWLATGRKSPGEIIDWFTKEQLTAEQERAAKLLESLPEQDFVHNIKAVGQENRDGHILDVNLRSRPAKQVFKEEFSISGEDIGDLKPGTVIEKAIAVEGPDPFSPWGSQKGRWFAFWDPQNPERAVFAYSGLFEFDYSHYEIRVHNVWH